MKKISEEIQADEDLITPERLVKGDLKITFNAKGKINSALPGERYLIEKLIEQEILDYHHKIYGMGFLELRAAFRSPWNAKCSAVLLERWGIGLSSSRAGEIYQNVCRGMLGRGLEVIQFALEMEVEDTKVYQKYGAGLYQEHFDRLVELMDVERKRAQEEERAKLKQEEENYGFGRKK